MLESDPTFLPSWRTQPRQSVPALDYQGYVNHKQHHLSLFKRNVNNDTFPGHLHRESSNCINCFGWTEPNSPFLWTSGIIMLDTESSKYLGGNIIHTNRYVNWYSLKGLRNRSRIAVFSPNVSFTHRWTELAQFRTDWSPYHSFIHLVIVRSISYLQVSGWYLWLNRYS